MHVLACATRHAGQPPEEAERALVSELSRFLDAGPTPQELVAVKRSTRTSVLAAALSNASMASLLASYHALTGEGGL
jgi:hypothetical protein